jgi:hypothetical protein
MVPHINDEHQGEGGTLVFVAFYITIFHVTIQYLLY